jgi:hypothetical protein
MSGWAGNLDKYIAARVAGLLKTEADDSKQPNYSATEIWRRRTMSRLKTQIVAAALTGVALCGVALPQAGAQPRGGPSGARLGRARALTGSPGTSPSIFVPPQVNRRPWWRSGNTNARDQYLQSLYDAAALNGLQSAAADGSGAAGDYLQAGAAVIQAQGQFMKDQQDAFRMKEEVRRLRTENRLLSFLEEQYERENTPTPDEIREQRLLAAQRRALTNPPATEIWSARSLNDLLPLVQYQCRRAVRPALPLSSEVLEHINLTTRSGGNLGLLKSKGQLSWPWALRQPTYAAARTRLAALLPKAVNQARSDGQVDSAVLRAMNVEVAGLGDTLKQTGKVLAAPEYIEAKRFLSDLEGAVKALGQDDVGDNFDHNEFQGKTVADLIDYMMAHGLQFAPAVVGDEPAYTALHQALVDCVGGFPLASKR